MPSFERCKSEALRKVSQYIIYLLSQHKANEIKFSCAQYIWCMTWKNVQNGKLLAEAESYGTIPMLVGLTQTTQQQVRKMAAGALWGLCGNRGGNRTAIAEIAKKSGILYLHNALTKTENKIKEIQEILRKVDKNSPEAKNLSIGECVEWEKESFVYLGALYAMCDVNVAGNCKVIVQQHDGVRFLIQILKEAFKRYHEIKNVDRRAPEVTMQRISKCTELLGQILLIDSTGRKQFLHFGGEMFILMLLRANNTAIRNNAIIVITHTAMADFNAKRKIASKPEIIELLIKNVNGNQDPENKEKESTETKYNSVIALAALCYYPMQTSEEKMGKLDQEKLKIIKDIQNIIFQSGGVSRIKEFLNPMSVNNVSFQVLPIRIGLRLATDICRYNKDIQKYFVETIMLDCLCCHQVLAKKDKYGKKVSIAALKVISAMAQGNQEAQDLIRKHNVNHFIMANVLKSTKTEDVELQMACAHALFAMCENNEQAKTDTVANLKRYECTSKIESALRYINAMQRAKR
eukprot:CAMPEP_0167754502 /NCGR_PEP_ID=MMETSP0110_2-20121227/8301_1 /TAXON_ID=629695 /ORGANISM="Gymnochlora sp., Strain CCMP2014" /LENGTH=518 /DNA_ID=CAMNT_0007640379 /DNA_START=357 /DNA_END=1913 /DNA_ORIENTATION=-